MSPSTPIRFHLFPSPIKLPVNTMTKRVRNATLILLLAAIGSASSPLFGQTVKEVRPQKAAAPLVKGKNVTVYLEDAEFGILAEKFLYDPNARLVDLQDDNRKAQVKYPGPISTAHFVDTSAAPQQPAQQPKKMIPRSLGTSLVPKPLHGKKTATEELSFDTLSQIPLTKRKTMPEPPIRLVSGFHSVDSVATDEIHPMETASQPPLLTPPPTNTFPIPHSPQNAESGNFLRSNDLAIPDPLLLGRDRQASGNVENAPFSSYEIPNPRSDLLKMYSPEPAYTQTIPETQHVVPPEMLYDDIPPDYPPSPSDRTSSISYVFDDPYPSPQPISPRIAALAPSPITSRPVSAPVSVPTPRPAPPGSGSSLAWTKGKFTITPYGYVNLSAAWESQRTAAGDYCVYAQSPELNPASDRSAFYVDPRSSRIGTRIDGPGFDCWSESYSRGVFEIDFQGAYQSRNRSGFLLRKAFVEIGDKRTKFLFGQDWEIVAPLYPNIFNYPAGSGSGNIGYRRAMIRMDHTVPFGCDSSGLFQFAICDNTVRDYVNNAATDPRITASGWPILQARFAWAFGEKTFSHGLPVTIGVSGQIGEQKGDFGPSVLPAGQGVEYGKSLPTWVVCLDFDIPVTQKLRLQAEIYDGENLSNLEGGIIQGVDMVRRDTIRCRGGWGAVMYQWTKKMKTNVGYAIEDPYNQDLLGTAVVGNGAYYTARTYNHSIFGNVMYNWTEAFMTGVELSQWKTNWQKYTPNVGTEYQKPGEPFRIEFVTRYTF